MDGRKASLLLMHRLGAHNMAGGDILALGVVFAAHRVQPARGAPFQPNRFLTITPEFLEAAILHVRKLGFDIISLDEAHARLLDNAAGKARGRSFACFTFDDGYRDNRIWAYPVLAKHNVPHTIYVPAAFAAGHGVLWWELLERVVASRDEVDCEEQRLNTTTTKQKSQAFAELVRRFTSIPPPEAHAFAVRLAARHGIDSDAVCRELIMGWDDLAEFVSEGLLTIGGHTVNHYRLARLAPDVAAMEMEQGLARIEAHLGERPCHFSYPFGDPSSAGAREFEIAQRLGLKTAVTTNSGVISARDSGQLTSLSRLCLNRVCDDVRCLEVLMSGVPSALFKRLRGSL